MIKNNELILLSNFASTEQKNIVDVVFSCYNTTHDAGIKTALGQAAWMGYCQAIDDIDKLLNRKAT